MRAMNHLEVWSPADAEGALHLAELCLDDPRLRYIRLERQRDAGVYQGRFCAERRLPRSATRHGRGVGRVRLHDDKHSRAPRSSSVKGPADRSVPHQADRFAAPRRRPSRYKRVVTVEEQLLQGGFGSAVPRCCPIAASIGSVRRVGMRDGFDVVNGNRDHLHALYGIDVPDIIRAAAG
jgi:transketolase C-terminal domain/subunit